MGYKKLSYYFYDAKETSVNHIQHVDMKLNHDEIKKTTANDPHHSKIIKDIEKSNTMVNVHFTLDPQGILH